MRPYSYYLIGFQQTIRTQSWHDYLHKSVRWCSRRPRISLPIALLLLGFVWYLSTDSYNHIYKTWVAEHPHVASRILLDGESSWNCTGTQLRNRVCTFQNLCIDRRHGAYIMLKSSDTFQESPPNVNLISAGTDADIYWTPTVVPLTSAWNPFSNRHVNFINETLFIYGLYSPFHFSHQLYNGMLPLYSTMQEYSATRLSWTFRPKTFWFEPHIFDIDFITNGKDIVLHENEVTTHQQTLPPSDIPICFANAVAGSGNRCTHWYCDNKIPEEHLRNFREDVLDFYVNSDHWRETITHSTEHDLSCTHHINEYSPLKPELKQPPTIGLLNRVASRHITNMPELFNSLRKAIPYAHFKIIEFDSGCSMPATAFLMKDIDVLIAPFGNGLGSGIFMRPNRVLISINARWYNEDWFFWVATAMGRRIFNFECLRPECQEKDFELAEKLLANHDVTLNPDELAEFVNTDHRPDSLLDKIKPVDGRRIYEQYGKDAKRKADVERLVPFVSEVVKDMVVMGEKWVRGNDELDYVKLCQDGKCCGPSCEGVMDRNVFGKMSAWQFTNGSGANWVYMGNT